MPTAEAGTKSRGRALVRVALATLALLAVGLTIAAATVDRWLMDVMHPGPFDAAATPPAPDYTRAEAWAATPAAPGGAEVSLADDPARDPADAEADVFYVHPTTWLGPRWNAPIDDPEVVAATRRGATLIQASVFNACCAVYAPRYRQAHGHAFVRPDAAGAQAIDIAFADVSAAFDEFLARTASRPFLIAGHSQGTVLAARLLRERVAHSPLQARLVAAYLPGGPIRAETVGGLPVCATARSTGCVVAWNARGLRYRPNGLEFDAPDPTTMAGRLCVNPITWSTDGARAPAEQHAGAVFFDTEAPARKPAFADAQCVGGTLVITTMGDPERDLMSRLLLWITGPENYHPIEYQLFYLDIRRNARERVDAFQSSSTST